MAANNNQADSPDLFDQPNNVLINLDDTEENVSVVGNANDAGNETDFDDDEVPRPFSPQNAQPLEEDPEYIDIAIRNMEVRQREESEHQEMVVGYMSYLREMYREVDAWLNGPPNQPISVKLNRFANHNWVYSTLTLGEKFRVNRLRFIITEREKNDAEQAEERFWAEVENNELRMHEYRPLCSICRFDLRNPSFNVYTLDCGHLFHERCVQTHLRISERHCCPNCNFRQYRNGGNRAHITYE